MIYFICWNWYMLKFRLWLNHIHVSQSISSKLNLEEKKLSLNCTSIRSLWVSTQDQSGTVFFNLNFGSSKFSLLNLNEAWIVINTWSFSLIFFFSSSLDFSSCFMLPQNTSNQQLVGCPTPWAWDPWDSRPKGYGVGMPKERRKREEERAWGSFGHGEGLALITLGP